MKRALFALSLMVVLSLPMVSQDQSALIEAFQRNFASASLNTKLELLKEAASYENVNMGPLFELSIKFVLDNVTFMANDNKLREIAIFSTNMLRKNLAKSAALPIWNLFVTYKDYTVRAPAALALGDLAQGNSRIIENLNSFLANQNSLFKSGLLADYPTLEAVIIALGRLGDPSSFSLVFSAYNIGYNEVITKRSLDAMTLIKGDYKAMLIDIINRSPMNEKGAALTAGMETEKLTKDERGEIAEAALSAMLGIQTADPKETVVQKNVRTLAVKELIALKWTRASPLAVKNFQTVRLEFLKSRTPKSSLLDAVALLGAMGTSEAAEALTAYMELINSETEQTNSYDEQLTLAVISNLGLLGDKVAFNHLLYVSYLKYSDSIKKAAREALKKIKL